MEGSTPADGFEARPHWTLFALALPIVVSLVAEPLVGLADTAFIARLGAGSTAALGVATVVLSGTFWVFNFLGIATQTEVAQAAGAGDKLRAGEATGHALFLSICFGSGIAVLFWPLADSVVHWMGASGETALSAMRYLRIRLFAAPAVLLTLSAFGVLRGRQDMKTPLVIAVVLNLLNAILDPILIFGWGGAPRLGIAGAAWASTVSHWVGALLAVSAATRNLTAPLRIRLSGITRMLRVGWNLFLRTGLLMLFLLIATRTATEIGDQAGAAHQAIRQVWLMTAFVLDAYAGAAQSLVGYFHGRGLRQMSRRVARLSCLWALATGAGLSLFLWVAEPWVARLLVPESAFLVFRNAWVWAVWLQPINALSFVTDGIHWATMDYAFLRNVMLAASVAGGWAVVSVGQQAEPSLFGVWGAISFWIGVRALLGVLRIWPGFGASPLAVQAATPGR